MELKKKPTNKEDIQNEHNITPQAVGNLKDILAENEFSLKLGEHIYLQAKEKIENNDMQYISEGKEGMVYKIEIETPDKKKKTLLAVKRRFDDIVKEEIHIQKKFFERSEKSETGVKVPEAFGQIQTADGKYFLMEYIQGKTLFTLKLEKIAERFYDKFKAKYPTFFTNMRWLNKDIDEKNINARSRFNFENDTEAREAMQRIISFLNESQEGMMKKYTNIPGIVLLDKKNFDDIIEKIYHDESMEIRIFEQKEGRVVNDKIQNFLYECHKEGLYHKDLGGNTTNIMFIQKDEKIIPVIIDFGKGEINENYKTEKEYRRGEGPYGDEKETHIPDTDICNIIRSLTVRPPKREPRELYF